MTTIAMTLAKERQLDWLLDEVLGEALGGGRAAAAARRGAFARPWLAAAIALLAVGAALGVAWLRAHDDDSASAPVQQPAPTIVWRECHGPAALDQVPADTTALKCFDFDDAACARLAKFTKLEHLDLSGMDVNDKGYAVSLTITDAGVRALAPLVALRSLKLSGCSHMKGAGLRALEAIPQLEQLDLTYSGVETIAVERLARMPSLRTLSLASCMNFHGRAIAAVARIPGLRSLDLSGCVTISAKDALHLAKLVELRRLDLRDCQGRFRGQTEGGLTEFNPGAEAADDPEQGDPADPNAPKLKDADVEFGEPLPPSPVQDGIGITDDVVAALASLPLESLKLGGSESLTDAIGASLAKMTTLRELDVSNLPKTTGALLARVPPQLEELRLDENNHLTASDFARLPALPRLHTFGLSGLALDEPALRGLLAGKPLRVLALGGPRPRGLADTPRVATPPAAVVAALVVAIPTLEVLDLSAATFVDRQFLAAIAAAPRLRALDLTAPLQNPLLDRSEAIAGLAGNTSIRELKLVWSRLSSDALRSLAKLPLRELDLRATACDDATVRDLAAKHWRGCVVTLPSGARLRAE